MRVKRITPVLYVKEIEPCADFWTQRLGFTKTAEVPDGGRLGFVILEKDGLEIMYQTFASAEKDAPSIAREVSGGRAFLYIEVESLQTVRDSLKGVPVVVPERTAPYGARELGVKDPAGHVVLFAEFPKPKV
ncbi:MAG TPA: VOC family protein [Candidatus Angelobacter sp.]|nr:VOC family protein [Candidatus Angelobacter sp.]